MAQAGEWSEVDRPLSPYKAPVPCYNCGSPDHLFTACPEPTRTTPAGFAAAAAAKAAAIQAQSLGNGYAEQQAGYGYNRSLKGQRYQGPVVTKYPTHKAPVITRFAQPQSYQSQPPPGTYAPSNPAPYNQPPPPQQQNYGQYGQNYAPLVQQPPPPPPNYSQHNQQHGHPSAPPLTLSYNQYGQPEYPPSQPFYNHQQMSQQYSQYPSQHIPAHGYQHGQQQGYSGPQGPYQGTDMIQQSPNGYQQPDYAGYQYPPNTQYDQPSNVQYNQMQGPPAVQPVQWGQPPAESYGPQQNGQQFNAPVQICYAQPQQQYSYEGSYNHTPAPVQHNSSQMALPQPQQYAEPQYTSPIQQYSSEQPNYENHQNEAQFAHSSYPDGPDYLPPNYEPGLTRESRSASVVSQTQEDSQVPEVTDEEEIEWMLERHLTRRMAKSSMTKSIKDLTTDDYYSLLSEDPISSCDPVGQPLPDNFNEDPILPPKYGARGVISKFIYPGNAPEFIKSIRDQSPLNSFGRDPVFLDCADAETWSAEFSRWVDYRCRIALGIPSLVPGSKSRKRTSPPREDARGCDDDQQPYGQPNHSKRARITGLDHSQSNSVGSKSSPTSVAVTKEEATPSFDRETTPSFDISEGVQDGEEDPWAVEPGEGLQQVDHKEAIYPAQAYGDNSYRQLGSQKEMYNNREMRQDSNSSNGHVHAPQRQDSGYMSARGSSYSSSNSQYHPYAEIHRTGQNSHFQPYGQNNAGHRPQQSHRQEKMKDPSPMSSDSDPSLRRSQDSPLTPTFTSELVGQTVLPLQDPTKVHHQLKHGATVKIRRPKPNVEAVYGRRW